MPNHENYMIVCALVQCVIKGLQLQMISSRSYCWYNYSTLWRKLLSKSLRCKELYLPGPSRSYRMLYMSSILETWCPSLALFTNMITFWSRFLRNKLIISASRSITLTLRKVCLIWSGIRFAKAVSISIGSFSVDFSFDKFRRSAWQGEKRRHRAFSWSEFWIAWNCS